MSCVYIVFCYTVLPHGVVARREAEEAEEHAGEGCVGPGEESQESDAHSLKLSVYWKPTLTFLLLFRVNMNFLQRL